MSSEELCEVSLTCVSRGRTLMPQPQPRKTATLSTTEWHLVQKPAVARYFQKKLVAAAARVISFLNLKGIYQ